MLQKGARKAYILDADVFLSYLMNDDLFSYSNQVIQKTVSGDILAYVSSILYDDIITALLSKGVDIDEIVAVITGLSAIPHVPLPVTPKIAISALLLYKRFRGSRKLHYFDSFHVSTSLYYKYPLITSDKFIIDNKDKLGIRAIDLRSFKTKNK
ncbi:MAG: PIN domain-containing protein [Candidatus Odinarchaeota archaeon]|nr:PIN domain-containing protein [Candidatus Odinarchaeota archaeon]